jgi:hypothetical protein
MGSRNIGKIIQYHYLLLCVLRLVGGTSKLVVARMFYVNMAIATFENLKLESRIKRRLIPCVSKRMGPKGP